MSTRRDRRSLRKTRALLAAAGILAICAFAALPLFASDTADHDSLRAMRQAALLGPSEAAWSGGLDVRDSQNRPVSQQALRRGLRAGESEQLREAAALSRVPDLPAVLEYVDRLRLGAGLRTQPADTPSRIVAVAAQRAPKALAAASPAHAGIVVLPSGNGRPPFEPPCACGRLSRAPLRC